MLHLLCPITPLALYHNFELLGGKAGLLAGPIGLLGGLILSFVHQTLLGGEVGVLAVQRRGLGEEVGHGSVVRLFFLA
jgi:hypothetical protein